MKRLWQRAKCAVFGHDVPHGFPTKTMGTAQCPKCGKAAFGYARIPGMPTLIEWWRL